MKGIFWATLLTSALITAPIFAHGGGHGGGGGGGHGGGGHGGGFGGGGGHMGGGGFSGGHTGGFSGGHSFSGGHPGSFSGGAMHSPSFGGMRASPSMGSLHSPSFGGLRTSPSIGSLHSPSLGGLRTSPSIGSMHSPSLGGLRSPSAASNGALRMSPNISGLRSPNLNPGSLNRSSAGSLSRATVGNVRPNLGSASISPRTTTPGAHATLGNRTALGGLGQSGLRLNQGAGAHTSLRPGANLGNSLGNSLGNHSLGNLGAVNATAHARPTPQGVNNFLHMNHQNVGGHNFGGAGVQNISHLGNANVNHHFNHLNHNQITNLNNNLNNGFRHNHGNFGFNNGWGYNRIGGFGYNRFGFGFGNPFWNNWGLGVRGFWNPYGYYGLFGNRFWATNYAYFPWRRSYYYWGAYPYSYWWNYPTWGGLTNWFGGYGWNTPYYYGYGPGGNIVYNNGQVYMNDVPIATAEDYAASAAELATVPTPANPDVATDWLPLGTFALSESEADKNPSRVVQLAVDKDGIVSGTMFNKTTNQTFPIQGRVDKETQRVAFTVGDAKDVVFETGIYNLTQQQTPILVHGEGREETYLMLRLEQPADGAATPAPGTPAAATPPLAAPAPATPAPPLPGDISPHPPGPTPVP